MLEEQWVLVGLEYKGEYMADNQNILQTLLDSSKKASDSWNPYQEGVAKGLKKAGEQQAVEALQSGVPHDHIVKESGLDPNKSLILGDNTDGGQILRMLLASGSQSPQPMQPESQTNSMPLIQEQAQPTQPGVATPQTQAPTKPLVSVQTPENILQTLFQQRGISADAQGNITIKSPGLFNITPSVGGELDNAQKLQKLLGKEPMQSGEYQKVVLESLQKQSEAGTLKPNELFTKYESAAQPFITVRDAHARVEASAKDPSAAGDLAMIFNYMKVLDPGSTVREGEFATAQNSAGLPQRIRAQYNSVINGKRLGNAQRTDFLDRSRRLFKSQESQHKKTTSEFKKLAEQNGIPFQNIIRDVGLQQEESVSKASSSTPSNTVGKYTWR
jgi:hypothetical protein